MKKLPDFITTIPIADIFTEENKYHDTDWDKLKRYLKENNIHYEYGSEHENMFTIHLKCKNFKYKYIFSRSNIIGYEDKFKKLIVERRL